MRKYYILILFLLFTGKAVFPQSDFLKDKTYYEDVIPYENEGMVRDDLYEQSPYFYALQDGWRKVITDTSVVYTRLVEPEKTWKDYAILLNFRCSKKSIVKLNGTIIASYDDYYPLHTANLTNLLKYGKANVLTIEALKTSPFDVISDPETGVGLIGTPYLIFKGFVHVCEYNVSTEYSDEGGGTLSLDVSVASVRQKGKYYIDVLIYDIDGKEFDRVGQWIIVEKNDIKNVQITRSWKNINSWNADNPSYYTLVLKLRDENMNIEEIVGRNIAFRSFTAKNGGILLNGIRTFMKGVIYGKQLLDDATSRSDIEITIKQLKYNNVNAIFFRHAPSMDETFFRLCDKYGIYVIGTADVKPVSNMHLSVSSDKKYIPLFESRVTSMVNAYKNHPSVIGWTIGDVNDNGICTQAALAAVRKLDKGRILFGIGDQAASLSDIYLVDEDYFHRNNSALVGDKRVPFSVFLNKDNDATVIDSFFRESANTPNCGGIFLNAVTNEGSRGNVLRQIFCPIKISDVVVGMENVAFSINNNSDFVDHTTQVDYTLYSNKQPDIVSGQLMINIKRQNSERIKVKLPPLKPLIGEEFFIKLSVATMNGGEKEKVLQCAYPLNVGVEKPFLSTTSKEIKGIRKSGDTVDIMLENLTVRYYNGRLNAIDTSQNIICRVPLPTFTSGSVNCDSLFLKQNDKHSVTVETMLHGEADGVADMQIREVTTVYATGDIVNQYQMLNTIVEQSASVTQNISFNSPLDTIKWFGNEHNDKLNGIPNVYKVPTKSSFSATGTRWLSAQCADNRIYVSQVATPFSYTLLSDRAMHMELMPIIDSFVTTYNYHLNIGSVVDIPDSLYGYEYRSQQLKPLLPPVIKSSSEKFTAPMTISITSKDNAIVRYTTDGSTPTLQSAIYNSPFVIDSSTIVKACCIFDGQTPSFVSTRFFSYNYIKSTTFSRHPNTPYNQGTDSILFDGATSTADDLDNGWLGFSGGELTIRVELSKQVDVDHVEIRFAHNPTRWAFSPDSVSVTLIDDSNVSTATTGWRNQFNPSDEVNSSPRVSPFIIHFSGQSAKYLTFKIHPIAQIPSWHKAKGLKPWLMIDELKIVEQPQNYR